MTEQILNTIDIDNDIDTLTKTYKQLANIRDFTDKIGIVFILSLCFTFGTGYSFLSSGYDFYLHLFFTFSLFSVFSFYYLKRQNTSLNFFKGNKSNILALEKANNILIKHNKKPIKKLLGCECHASDFYSLIELKDELMLTKIKIRQS